MIRLKEIEVTAFRGLFDMLTEDVAITAFKAWGQGFPFGFAVFQFLVIQFHLDQALVHVNGNHVAGLY